MAGDELKLAKTDKISISDRSTGWWDEVLRENLW